MTTDLTDQLRADMARFTRDVHVPPGLALKAYRHDRRHRVLLRVAIATGTTAVLAAGAVTAAGATGAFVSTATQPIQTAAYIIKKVESALAPANAGSLMEYTRTTFSPPESFEPPQNVTRLPLGPSSKVALVVSWQYGATQHESDYGQDGQHVFDVSVVSGKNPSAYTVVDYNDHTWYTESSRGPTWIALMDPSQQFKSIRQAMLLGGYTSVSRQVVDGIDAIKLTDGSQHALWVNPVTFLPVRYVNHGAQTDYQWLSATPANLALLDQTIPAGFRQTPWRGLYLTLTGWQP